MITSKKTLGGCVNIAPESEMIASLVERPGYTFQPPVTFRLPKPGMVDPYFGGPRTFWNEHVLPTKANKFKPPIRSVVERRHGATRGIRFILFGSAVAYFEKLAKEQDTAAQDQENEDAREEVDAKLGRVSK
jgi:hypothetical protein